MSQAVGLPNNSYKHITNTVWIRSRICCLQKGRTRLAAYGRWFSPGPLASSITKTGRLDIAEILLKVALNTINQIRFFSNNNNIQNSTRQSKTSVCLTKVTINMITLSVIIPCRSYFQSSLLKFCFLLLCMRPWIVYS